MNTFSITGGMTIYEAEILKNQLLAELAQTETLLIDLTAVSEIDTTGLQLLLTVKRDTKVTLGKHSHCILQLANLLQLHQQLGIEKSWGIL